MAQQRNRLGMQLRFRRRIEIQGEQEHRPLRERLNMVVHPANLLRSLDRQTNRVKERQESAETDHQEDDSPVDLEHALREAHIQNTLHPSYPSRPIPCPHRGTTVPCRI